MQSSEDSAQISKSPIVKLRRNSSADDWTTTHSSSSKSKVQSEEDEEEEIGQPEELSFDGFVMPSMSRAEKRKILSDASTSKPKNKELASKQPNGKTKTTGIVGKGKTNFFPVNDLGIRLRNFLQHKNLTKWF